MAARCRLFAFAISLSTILGFLTVQAAPTGIPILVYHRFDPDNAPAMTVRTSTFTGQLDWLAAHHYQIIPLDQALNIIAGKAPPLATPAVVITMDDGNESVFTQAWPVIQARHIPITLFIYPSPISRASYALTWDQISKMLSSGLVEVQSHTYWHPNFNHEREHRTPADYQAFVDMQLTKSKSVLEQKLNVPISVIAWPYGIVNPDLEAAAQRAGYQYGLAFTGGPAQPGADPFAIPRIPVPDYARGRGFAHLLEDNLP